MKKLKGTPKGKTILNPGTTVAVCLAAAILMIQANIAFGEQENGPASITLEGGSLGNIVFPHGKHQVDPKVCTPCHSLFPQESHAVQTMKSEGKLERKEVMNMCRGCHKELESKGEKAGPTSCSGCHKK